MDSVRPRQMTKSGRCRAHHQPAIGPTRWRRPGMTEEKFSCEINLICPVQCCLRKYSASRFTQIKSISPAIPSHTEGRFAIVTDVGSGMRWTRMALLTRAPVRGRRSRVVLTPRRWRQVDGVIRRRRWQTSPVTGESTKETVKTTRVRECRVIPVRPW
jgi:hypothetical protein